MANVKELIVGLQWCIDQSIGKNGLWGNGLINYRVMEKSPGNYSWSRFNSGIWYQPVNDASLEAVKAAAEEDYRATIAQYLSQDALDAIIERAKNGTL